ncbi:MAG TPA: ATP-binding cassette domain-containing protein [Actinophytocola sp.]|nr:ATP-binding cassette domain-containing protein [Actinophytocola sp.]
MANTVPELLVRLGRRSWRFGPQSTVLVGRDDDCDVHVDDPRVSRRHLRIGYQDGWVVEDLTTTHGTWVDSKRLVRHPVLDRVTLRLADAADGRPLELWLDPPPRRPASPPGVLTIGRAGGNDVVLNDVRVSRRHARLDRVADGWRLTDLGSRNGLVVNSGTVGGPVVVRDGDRLTFGGTDLLVTADGLMPAGGSDAALVATELGYTLPDGRPLLSDVDLQVRPGELVAIVGPSGAGKSTLLKVLTGALRPGSGSVRYDGHDVHDEFDAVRSRIGLVPQDDLVHGLLTPRQALSYSAMLRLPGDTGRGERRAIVDATLAELSMTEHAGTRIASLSGGQRKRVSVALELLTSPSLLLLDEPTSGLDPALDRKLMTTLRGIADAGRAVVVVTHNVAELGQCDTVLVLAPGGIPVYSGPPSRLTERFGTSDWADVFTMVSAEPPPARGDAPAQQTRRRPVRRQEEPAEVRATVARQVRVLVRRHARLVLADRGYALFLAALPVLLGVLALAVPGDAGLRNAAVAESVEASQILVLVFVGAAFMGGAAGAREVVGERDIVLRERAAGVLPFSYAAGKAVVFGAVCAVQAVLLVAVLVAVKPPPATSTTLPGATLELVVAVWVTAAAACLLGLLGSALVRSTEQAMPVLVVTVMAQLVLCGGMIPVSSRVVLEQLSWLAPARWGYSAGAATVGLNRPGSGLPIDLLWTHDTGHWLLAVAVLAAMAAVFVVLLAVRMRRMRSRQ